MVECRESTSIETRRKISLKILLAVIRNARKLCEKQPALVNRNGPILLHDSSHSDVARVTQTKLNNLGIKVLQHPSYSPDFSLTDFHFIKHLDNFTINIQFQNHAAVEEAFKVFIESRDVDFYRKGINDHITHWQKYIQPQGCYFY